MNENMDYPVWEFEDCINYIADKTKLDKEIIESVLNVETEFMEKVGIVVTDNAEKWEEEKVVSYSELKTN